MGHTQRCQNTRRVGSHGETHTGKEEEVLAGVTLRGLAVSQVGSMINSISGFVLYNGWYKAFEADCFILFCGGM